MATFNSASFAAKLRGVKANDDSIKPLSSYMRMQASVRFRRRGQAGRIILHSLP